MKRVKIAIFVVIAILLISMTIYDFIPYQDSARISQQGSTSRSYDLVFNSTTSSIEMWIDPVIDIQDPFSNTNSTYLLSYEVNISVLVESSQEVIYAFSGMTAGVNRILTNMTHVFKDVRLNGNRQWCLFLKPGNTTEVNFVFSYIADYTVEILYNLQPKTYAWASVLSFLSMRGIILVGVILFSAVLIFAGIKLASD
ncbi:MAG: hypothetical protein ACFFF9_13800 [Candidatus Thorarchaeota archaeon]